MIANHLASQLAGLALVELKLIVISYPTIRSLLTVEPFASLENS